MILVVSYAGKSRGVGGGGGGRSLSTSKPMGAPDRLLVFQFTGVHANCGVSLDVEDDSDPDP